MVCKSAKYYRSHPKARAKKAAYDTKLNSRPQQVAKRVELNKANREHDAQHGKASRRGLDLSHTARGLVYKPKSVNRGSKTDTAGDRRSRGGKATKRGK